MKATLEQVVHDADELSPRDREILVARLIRDLDPVEDFSDAGIEEAWDKEIARRIEEIESGKVKSIPAEEVFARIQSRLDEAS